jgi:hypothetical protein
MEPKYEKITTVIRTDIKKQMNKEGITAKMLLNIGWLSHKQNPQILSRLRKAEADIEHLKAMNHRLYERIIDKQKN